jgi:hypothetical protein
MVVAGLMLFSQPAIADDLADLKATHMKLQKSVNTGDFETMFGILDDRSVKIGVMDGWPHVLKGKEHKAMVKQMWAKYFETHRVRVSWYKADYRVVGNMGLVWGLEGRNVMSEKGPTKRYFLKLSLVFVKTGGSWKLILSHSTPIPPTQTIY